MLKFALVFLFFLPSFASACQCRKADVESGFANSELVFGAYVIGANVKKGSVVINLDNSVSLKGDRTLHRLITPNGRSACGLSIVVPGKYIFFTNKDGEIDSCGASRVFDDPDIARLTAEALQKWDDLDRKKKGYGPRPEE